MSEQFEQNDALSSASNDQNLVSLIKTLQRQVTFLEKKIDQLIIQSSSKPSFSSGKSYSKPYRSFDRPRHHSDSSGGYAGREKSYERGSHFKKSEGEESRGFGYKKKSYGDHRESTFSPERHFAKRSDGPREGFDHKKKSSFPYKRKSRE